MTKTPPTMAPAPASLAAALASAGLDVELAVTRQDGSPLTDDDRAAVEALVACHDLEVGRAVDDDEAAMAVFSPGEAFDPNDDSLFEGSVLTEEGEKELLRALMGRGRAREAGHQSPRKIAKVGLSPGLPRPRR